jgi:hypothetical protein
MHKITRLCFNSAGWQRPTGHARGLEAPGTYNHENGFGHEEWLFRSDWSIDGWRYGFVQGVNKGGAKVIREGKPLDLTVFTIEPDKRRRLVADIYDVECLADADAKAAFEYFVKQGWHDQMKNEILAVGGDVKSFGASEWASKILNVRFRIENIKPFPADAFVPLDDPILEFTRYQLYDVPQNTVDRIASLISGGLGSTLIPTASPVHRRGAAPVSFTPEHIRIQAKLMELLKIENPDADILREAAFIDVSMRTPTEIVLFEIKSDLDPRTVIRHAIGQILEYAFHPSRSHDKKLRLVIVGQQNLSPGDAAYMEHLRSAFNLPLEYRAVSI